MADRFFPWFKLELEGQQQGGTGLLERAATAVGGLAPIDRNFYQADAKVTMSYGLGGNTFEVTIAGLPGPTSDTIEARKTSVQISLGYPGSTELVLDGVVQKKSLKAGECFYETTLAGVEKASFRLQSKRLKDEVPYRPNMYFLDLVDAICKAAEVDLDRTQATPGPGPRVTGSWSFEKKTALEALREINNRLHQIGDYALTVRDGKLFWYGRATSSQNNAASLLSSAVSSLSSLISSGEYSFDNYLVKADPINEDHGGERGVDADGGSDTTPVGREFEMLGDPQLRPGDTVTFNLKDNKGVPKPETLTIESITHDFSRTRGYRCTGRALQAETFLKHVFGGRASGAEAVREATSNMLARNQDRSPAVHVGDVTEYAPREHVVNTRLGIQSEPTMTSPSTQVPAGTDGFTLERRPMVAPFAWNLCGLVVPVYPGMRAVTVHNRYLREDALLNGFTWTEEMKPPPNQAGDYWLCLPLDVPSDRAPNDSDKAANDLTTGDGKRVVQLKGLRMAIGEGLLENLGTRPGNVGVDNELQIEHSSGAKITMKDNEIKMEAGGRTLSIAGGKVSVT